MRERSGRPAHDGAQRAYRAMAAVRLTAAAGVLAVAATACVSTADDAANRPRVVEVRMVDHAFEPSAITVRAGERVRFEFTNAGSVVHEAYLGDAAAQAAHEREMAGSDGHSAHGGGDKVTVAPGRTDSLLHRFEEPGTLQIGCHQPGHWESGMRATVEAT